MKIRFHSTILGSPRTAAALLLLASASTSQAVLPFPLSTDVDGVITGGAWTGNGAIQTGVSAGQFSVDGITTRVLVDNFSGTGTLSGVGIGGTVYDTQNRLLDRTLQISHTITLGGGGTADLQLANSNANDGGDLLWNSTQLTGFSNVNSISFTTLYSSPIAGRDNSPALLNSRGMGAGLALINAGTGLGVGSFTVGLSYGGVYSAATPDLSVPFNAAMPGYATGVPSNAIPFIQTGFNTPAAGSTSFTSDAFTGTNQFLLVRGYDYDGSGNAYTAADAPRVYISSMTWTITRDDNLNFPSNTLLVWSMDGQQYGAVPEASTTLLGLSAVALLGLRRRRA